MKTRLLIIIGIMVSLGVSIIIIASNLQNYYLFDPNFTDKPSGVSIEGLKEEYRQGEPIEFAIRVHGFDVGCESVTVKIFNEWNAQPSLLYDKGFIAEDKSNLKPSQADYSCPITFKQFNDGKSGKYLVLVNYFQNRGSYGEIKQEFKVMSLPTLSELDVSKITFENTCTENQICYGHFDNGTKIRISCDDIAVHGCGVKSFENDTGIVHLGNQSYYFETPNYTETAYVNPVQISFHDVIFTLFPSEFRGGLPVGGCGGSYYWTDAMFPDNTHELLHIFVNFSPCVENSIPTMLSNHTNPQAGLFFSDNKMKILVIDSDLVVPRGDLFLQQPLRIEGLNETYGVGQKIEFTIKFDGIAYDCEYPQLKIENDNHDIIWESGGVVSLCDPDMKNDHIKKEWKIGDTTHFGTPIIDKEGFYTLFAEFADSIIQKNIAIEGNPNQTEEINSTFSLQKTQNKFPNVTQRQVVMQLHDQKSQDGALGVTILDKITREKPSDDVIYLEIIKQWDDFKIPESMFFNITLKDDDVPVSKPFLIQQSLLESHAGPLKDQFYFTLPINVPLLPKAKQGVLLFNYTMPDILPKDDRYHLKFASFSDVEVKLPNDVIVIENNTREYSEFWSYDENYALSHKADHLTIDYPSSSMDVNSVIIYDIIFEIRK